VWIYRCDTKKFLEISEDDPRVSRTQYCPDGYVQFVIAKPSRRHPNGKWMYCAAGATAKEAADQENKHVVHEIAKIEATLVKLRSRLVKP
jgi:hypothetical protein